MSDDQIAPEEPMNESVEEMVVEAPPVMEEVVDEVFRPRLIVKRQGVETEVMFEFAAPAVIGRFDPSVGPIDVDLGSIEEGVYVSRKHAKITETDGVYSIEDMGSSNGTYVMRDGEFSRVSESEISDGEEIAFGNARFVFRLS
jgi:pSer/pThr/pTyr-binding forkhead associated (FHA) protein